MNEFSQGDILKVTGFKMLFVVVSKNAYIKSTQMIHVCPIIRDLDEGPLHIAVKGYESEGVVICEQVRLIDPNARSCSRIDRLHYGDIMNVSDALQGIFEYD